MLHSEHFQAALKNNKQVEEKKGGKKKGNVALLVASETWKISDQLALKEIKTL